jgi:hypothetical protein
MSVIPLTIFFSLLLAGLFVLLFLREQRRRHLTSPERDSLLPLADETPVAAVGAPVPASGHGHDHDHADHAPAGHRPGDGRCGCRTGARPPCSGCLKRRDEQEPAYF